MSRGVVPRRPKTEGELQQARSNVAIINSVRPQYEGDSSASRMIDNLLKQQERKAAKRQDELDGAAKFAVRLCQLRVERGLTQAELARGAAVGQAMISLLEKGDRQPTWSTVCRLAEALGVGIEEFRK